MVCEWIVCNVNYILKSFKGITPYHPQSKMNWYVNFFLKVLPPFLQWYYFLFVNFFLKVLPLAFVKKIERNISIPLY